MTDLGKAPEQSSLCEQRTMDIATQRAPERVITFDITGRIFGVSRPSTRLNELSQSGRIGAWHIGPWVDWRHTAIRIKFDSVEDGKLSEHVAGRGVSRRPTCHYPGNGRPASGQIGARPRRSR